MVSFGLAPREAYALGDSPLVLLTALWALFTGSGSPSCRWVERARPPIDDSGSYIPKEDGLPLRVYTHLDTRLLLEDLYAKLELYGAGNR
jgi:hypothetical protein